MATIEENILHSLEKNGFPQKKVSLPFQALFKACKKAETNLSDVLKRLETQDVMNKVEGDKILFYTKKSVASSVESEESQHFDFSNKMVQDAMDKISSMAPEDLENLKKQVAELSPEEKSELLKQAKDLFKKPTNE
jgi:hypothetical protein